MIPPSGARHERPGVFLPIFARALRTRSEARISLCEALFQLRACSSSLLCAVLDGRIVWSAPLGIYGNCIVVDHGYGLQTIYSHLSRIDVHVGDTVKRSQVMGLSGMTGMAGGDHVHFAMQLDGVQIDPKNGGCALDQRPHRPACGCNRL
jgi:hypothetical protein